MKFTVTFNRAITAGACGSGYNALTAVFGGDVAFGMDTEGDLLTVLDGGGLYNALWCLRTANPSATNASRLIAADFCDVVLPMYVAEFPDEPLVANAIQAARDNANGLITDAAMVAAGVAAADVSASMFGSDRKVAGMIARACALTCKVNITDSIIECTGSVIDAKAFRASSDDSYPVLAVRESTRDELSVIMRAYLV